MKKVIMIIGVGLLCSCSTNQNTNEINELKNTIIELETEIRVLKDSIWMINYLSTPDIDDEGCGPQI